MPRHPPRSLRRPSAAEIEAALSAARRAPSASDLRLAGIETIKWLFNPSGSYPIAGGVLTADEDGDPLVVYPTAAGQVLTSAGAAPGEISFEEPDSGTSWVLRSRAQILSSTTYGNDSLFGWFANDSTSSATYDADVGRALVGNSTTSVGNVVSVYPGLAARSVVGVAAPVWRQSWRLKYQSATQPRFRIAVQCQGGGGSSVTLASGEFGVVNDATSCAIYRVTSGGVVDRTTTIATPVGAGGAFEVFWESDGTDLWVWVVSRAAATYGTVLGSRRFVGGFADVVGGTVSAARYWQPVLCLENRDAGASASYTGTHEAWVPAEAVPA